ncbi:MAG: hypothetical protein AAF399_22160 [Bacteroidota bacterium]
MHPRFWFPLLIGLGLRQLGSLSPPPEAFFPTKKVVYSYAVSPYGGIRSFELRTTEREGKRWVHLVPPDRNDLKQLPSPIRKTCRWERDTLWIMSGYDYRFQAFPFLAPYAPTDTMDFFQSEIYLLKRSRSIGGRRCYRFRRQHSLSSEILYTDFSYLQGIGFVQVDIIKSQRYPALNSTWVLKQINGLELRELIRKYPSLSLIPGETIASLPDQ